MVDSEPRYRTGKVCYIEIPAADVAASAEFYQLAFGWKMRRRGDGAVAFDDTVGEVSGTFVTGRPVVGEPGLLVYVMVARAEAALDAVRAAGGEVVRPVDPAAGEVFGWVRDPAGNVLGVYQQHGLAEAEASPRPVPEHLHTVTPRLVVRDARAAIEFYRAAFGAEQRGALFAGPGGMVVHAEIQLGDSVIYLTEPGDNGGEVAAPAAGQVNAIMVVTVPDVDELWARAVAAGCEVIYPLADQFYGEREGRLRDPFGQQWMLGRHIEDVDQAELDRRMQAWAGG
ncbi:MAG TPA: VOC family protein [Streptosporangiaceae bacterium]